MDPDHFAALTDFTQCTMILDFYTTSSVATTHRLLILHLLLLLSAFHVLMCFVLGFVKIGSQDCQRCCLGFSKLYSGIDEILIRDCQSCGYGLSKFLLEIVKTVIKNCQNCGLGMSKL